MKVTNLAEFRTDLPDDAVWEGDEIVQFGGRGVATAIAELLGGLGYRVLEPENGDEHGWWFTINQEDRQFYVQVTDLPPDILLLVSDVTWAVNRWFSKNGHLYGELVEKLKAALAADPRFHDIRWRQEDSLGRELGPDGKPVVRRPRKPLAPYP